jgi:[acyl-carrier-protein] S-malonyltransferase
MDRETAFLFPGQGSQFVGMGQEFIHSSNAAKARVEEANDILKFDIGKLILEGSEEELALTANTQPAILLISAIALEALADKSGELKPSLVAGHSLGEFSACLAAKVFDFDDAIRIVRKRGELMQSAVPVGVGKMAAVIGLNSEEVTACCTEVGGEVYPANFNSPEQTVIAGKSEDVIKAMKIADANGAKKTIPLTVSAPFHTRFMASAQEGLSQFLESIPFNDPETPIVRNVDATLARTADEVRAGLIEQVVSCVRWVDSMKKLSDMGITKALEIGPGKVLTGLMRRIDRKIKVTTVGAPDGVLNALEAANG